MKQSHIYWIHTLSGMKQSHIYWNQNWILFSSRWCLCTQESPDIYNYISACIVCASPWFSEVSPALLLKLFNWLFDWWCPFLLLSRKITKCFLCTSLLYSISGVKLWCPWLCTHIISGIKPDYLTNWYSGVKTESHSAGCGVKRMTGGIKPDYLANWYIGVKTESHSAGCGVKRVPLVQPLL